ncbi:hypothetical protein ACWDBO_17465 [Streptomyces mirabilis]|uniref:hypothetical protein n=1 Tax=Streptomyces TaxID=1883 RepID=UPI0029A19959|nr:hypothetical protein [Streptomyces sp. AK02-04a]MDX3759625.1 hypothetical protein [Streptomyces sp. AK02-04a]
MRVAQFVTLIEPELVVEIRVAIAHDRPGDASPRALAPHPDRPPAIDDDQHQWGWIGEAITGDPRAHGHVCLATDGRGIQFGQPA